MSDEESCPLCTEALDLTDRRTQLCGPKCPVICLWCWNQIMDNAARDGIEPRCPNCRAIYDKNKVKMKAIDEAELSREETQKREAKKKHACFARKLDLVDLRVVQRNLVYVVGLAMDLCTEEILRRSEYFGKYGRIKKISVNRNSPYSASRQALSGAAYVVYHRNEDALACIQDVDGRSWNGKQIRACFGTTKYCNAFLKSMPCNNPDCLYLHELSPETDSLTKADMHPIEGGRRDHMKIIHPGQAIRPDQPEESPPQPPRPSPPPAFALSSSDRDFSQHLPLPSNPTLERSSTWANNSMTWSESGKGWGSVALDPLDGADNARESQQPPSTAIHDWPSLGDAVNSSSRPAGPDALDLRLNASGMSRPARKDSDLRDKPSAADVVAGMALRKAPTHSEQPSKGKLLMPLTGKPRAISKTPAPLEQTSSVRDASQLEQLVPEANSVATCPSNIMPASTTQHRPTAPPMEPAAPAADDSSSSSGGVQNPGASRSIVAADDARTQTGSVGQDAAGMGVNKSREDTVTSQLGRGSASSSSDTDRFQLFGSTASLFSPQCLTGMPLPSSAAQNAPPLPPGFGPPVRTPSPLPPQASQGVAPPPGLESLLQNGHAGSDSGSAQPVISSNGAQHLSENGGSESIWSDYAKLDQMLVEAGLLTNNAAARVSPLPPGVQGPFNGTAHPSNDTDQRPAQNGATHAHPYRRSRSRFKFAHVDDEDDVVANTQVGLDVLSARDRNRQLQADSSLSSLRHVELETRLDSVVNGQAVNSQPPATSAMLSQPGSAANPTSTSAAASAAPQYSHFGAAPPVSVSDLRLPSHPQAQSDSTNPGMILLHELRNRQHSARANTSGQPASFVQQQLSNQPSLQMPPGITATSIQQTAAHQPQQRLDGEEQSQNTFGAFSAALKSGAQHQMQDPVTTAAYNAGPGSQGNLWTGHVQAGLSSSSKSFSWQGDRSPFMAQGNSSLAYSNIQGQVPYGSGQTLDRQGSNGFDLFRSALHSSAMPPPGSPGRDQISQQMLSMQLGSSASNGVSAVSSRTQADWGAQQGANSASNVSSDIWNLLRGNGDARAPQAMTHSSTYQQSNHQNGVNDASNGFKSAQSGQTHGQRWSPLQQHSLVDRVSKQTGSTGLSNGVESLNYGRW